MKSSHILLRSGLFGYLLIATLLTGRVLAQAPAGCTAANVFNQCLTDQDIYLKTCKDQEFFCLCKWNQAKLSCWNNCPNDPARATQEGLVQNYCAIASVYAPTSTTAAAPSFTAVSTSSSVSTTQPPSSSAKPSSSNAMSLAENFQTAQAFALFACVLLSAISVLPI